MRTLLLCILLLLGGLVKSQVWQADTLKYWSNIWYEPDTVITEEIIIEIDKGYITIVKHNAFFKAKIVDTLQTDRTGPYSYTKNYRILKTPDFRKDTAYEMKLYMSYYGNRLTHLGLAKGEQLFIYWITNQLINTNAKRTGINETILSDK